MMYLSLIPMRYILVVAIVFVGLLVIFSNIPQDPTIATRAAMCPTGTVYIERYDACIPGFRPWESAPAQ